MTTMSSNMEYTGGIIRYYVIAYKNLHGHYIAELQSILGTHRAHATVSQKTPGTKFNRSSN